MIKRFAVHFLFIIFLFSFGFFVHAQEFSSNNFKVSSPVIFPGGQSTSTSFGLVGVISQMAIGTSSSASFKAFGGFLYFPFVSTPIVSATPSDVSVGLSWTAADAEVGWAVGSYSVGQATVSGGPYTYTNVGLTLSSNVNGLTGGTPYYFIVRALDYFGNPISTSNQISITPTIVAGSG